MSRFYVLAALALVPAMHMCAPAPTGPTEASWPAVDDGPCPAGMFADVDPSWDYHTGAWFDAQGVMVGVAPEEDSCIRPVQ